MCGIFGLAWKGGAGLNDRAESAAKAMQRSLNHRGPDGTGMLRREGLILGHVRLAIIDLVNGAQPMASPDEKISLSYNGECYNFPALMEQLTRGGWNFQSRCDTEVLLAAFAQRGERFDEALNGMYAYAILDERGGDRLIHLSTDPVGIKPLFVFEDGNCFIFASELRAIVAAMHALGKPVEVDPDAVSAYLRLGWVPPPLSMVRGARKLPPGERWQINLDKWNVRQSSVRKLPSREPFAGTSSDLDDELDETLKQVIRRQTLSDVPLGFFLSGGIDSSLLLAVASELGLAAQSFTIRFVGDGHGVEAANEADVADAVARHLGAPIDIIDVDPATLLATIGDTFGAMDQPLADPACLPLLLLSKIASQSVKVCLSGDGGDELFAGYDRHRIAGLRGGWSRLPNPVRALGRRTATLLPAAPGTGVKEKLRKLRVGYRLIDSPNYVDGPFSEWLPHLSRPDERWNDVRSADAGTLMYADIEGQLAGQMLPKSDNMTMAASLECRVPLLDLDLIELASSLSLTNKRAGNLGKLPLRRLLARRLPPEITNRPKHGFRVPLTSWFRTAMAEEIRDKRLHEMGPINQFLEPNVIAELVNSHLAGESEHSIRIWSLLAFESWQKSITAPSARTPA